MECVLERFSFIVTCSPCRNDAPRGALGCKHDRRFPTIDKKLNTVMATNLVYINVYTFVLQFKQNRVISTLWITGTNPITSVGACTRPIIGGTRFAGPRYRADG